MAKVIAAYLRLSSKQKHHRYLPESSQESSQGSSAESNSITAQRHLIREYISEHQDLQEYIYEEYVDDGFSGSKTSTRKAFMDMINRARTGKIQCIIVKDFSRFTREAIVLGDYVEQIFPLLEIRFISITDRYDSLSASYSSMTSMNVSLKALVNAYYLKDQSQKRKTSIRTRQATGNYHGTPPYGYYRPDARSELCIDPEAAQIVKRIYAMALSGNNIYRICSILTEEQVPPPSQYFRMHPELRNARRRPYNDNPSWAYGTVRNILKNRTYTGALVNHLTEVSDTNKKKPIKIPENEQFFFEDRHPAIISKEDYLSVQKQLFSTKQVHTPRPSSGENTVLKGMIRCGYCRHTLRISHAGHTGRCINTNIRQNQCPRVRYNIAPIEQAVFAQITKLMEAIQSHEADMQKEIRRQKNQLPELLSRQSLLEKHKADLLTQKQQLFEDLVKENIPMTNFRMKKEPLSAQINLTQNELDQLETQISSIQALQPNRTLASYATQCSSTPQFTKELVREYLKDIYVKEDGTLTLIWKQAELFIEWGIDLPEEITVSPTDSSDLYSSLPASVHDEQKLI